MGSERLEWLLFDKFPRVGYSSFWNTISGFLSTYYLRGDPVCVAVYSDDSSLVSAVDRCFEELGLSRPDAGVLEEYVSRVTVGVEVRPDSGEPYRGSCWVDDSGGSVKVCFGDRSGLSACVDVSGKRWEGFLGMLKTLYLQDLSEDGVGEVRSGGVSVELYRCRRGVSVDPSDRIPLLLERELGSFLLSYLYVDYGPLIGEGCVGDGVGYSIPLKGGKIMVALRG